MAVWCMNTKLWIPRSNQDVSPGPWWKKIIEVDVWIIGIVKEEQPLSA
jgi:hypothetical protein